MTDETSNPEEEDRVEPGFACPKCGEDRIDYLVWDDDGEYVTCASCGEVYQP